MAKLPRDFYSKDRRSFRFHIGHMTASSLSGFIAGIIVTLIIIFALCDVALKG